VGGDFYDVLKLSEHRLLLSIADVMGKGLPAAMFAAILRGVLRAAPEWTHQPEKLLERANRMLFEELSGVDMFITAQLIFVDVAEERLAVASAGHCPLLLGTGGEAPIRTIAPEGLPLGILPDATYAAHTERLPRHSRVLLYTDGLTEARNSRGEFFGQERLINWFRKTLRTSRSADQLKEELAMELTEFQSQTPPADDQTFLIMA
jgi:serine phosphatase RsbU (regulator of sigma subunit)